MTLDYFYGAQADQFAFCRIPKALFTDERFKSISAEAKILYGILLDRMSRAALPARDGASLFEWMMEETDLPLEPDPAKDFETVSAKLTGGLGGLGGGLPF